MALKGDYAEAFHNLGITLQQQDRDEEALAAFRRAVSYRRDYTEAKIQIAVQLSKAEDHDGARDVLRQILSADPKNFAAHYYMGHTLTALGRFDDAITELEQARVLNPASHEVMFALGNAHNGARHDEEALNAYRAAINIVPGYLDAHYAYNLLAWTMGRHDLVLKSYGDARAKVGETTDLLLAEANQRIRHDDGTGAEKLLRRAHDAAPQRQDVTNALARALTLQKHHGDAAELLADAIRLDPGRVEHHRELGIALLQDRQLEAARNALEDALALAPHDQLTLAYLTLAYRELGDSRFEGLFDPAKYVRVFDIAPPSGHADITAFNNALGEELLALHTRQQEPSTRPCAAAPRPSAICSKCRGKAIAGLQSRIREAVGAYISDLPDDAAHPLMGRKARDFSFSGAWSCRLKSSGFHTNHLHHMGWLSSAYYVSAAGRDRPGQGQPGLAEVRGIPPRPG